MLYRYLPQMNYALQLRTTLRAVRTYASRKDTVLFGLAMLALILCIILFPRFSKNQLPGLHDRVDDKQAVQSAHDWVINHKQEQTNYRQAISHVVRSEEYHKLTTHLGYRDVWSLYHAYQGPKSPLLYTRVLYTSTGYGPSTLGLIIAGFEDGFDGTETANAEGTDDLTSNLRLEVQLNMIGEIIGFRRSGRQRMAHDQLNRDALEFAFETSIPDTLSASSIRIRTARRSSGSQSQTNKDLNNQTPQSSPMNEGSMSLDASAEQVMPSTRDYESFQINKDILDRLNRYHLRDTHWANHTLTLESTEVETDGEVSTAVAVYSAPDTLLGRKFSLRVKVSNTGHLHEITPASQFLDSSITYSNNRSVIATTTIVISVIIILILIMSRAWKRLIDTNLTRFEAWVGGLTALTYFILDFSSDSVQQGFISLDVGFAAGLLFGGLFMFGAGFLLIKMLSAYSSSVTQEVWPSRLKLVNLARKGYWINQPVGMALIRGVLGGLALTGLVVILVSILPIQGLAFDSNTLFQSQIRPLASFSITSIALIESMIILFLVFLTAGTLAYKRIHDFRFAGLIMLLFWLLMYVSPATVNSATTNYLIVGILGICVIGLFKVYGPFTAAIAIFFTHLFWEIFWGLSFPSSPDKIQMVLLLMLPLGALLAGTAGLRSGRNELSLPEIIPDYLIEMANRERMERELEISRQVQQRLLPGNTPSFEGFEFMAGCTPATEVGGDYYEFLSDGGKQLGVAIGDVSGKGFQAAFYMTLIKGFTQSLAEHESQPEKFLSRINSLFYKNAERGTFVSMIIGFLDTEKRTFRFARAGHNPPIWYKKSTQSASYVNSKGMAIGLIPDNRFSESLEPSELQLSFGDLILLYTDGYTEAMNRSGELYGEQRLLDVVEKVAHLPLRKAIRAINEDLRSFTRDKAQSDDMTLLAIKVLHNEKTD